jgi:serine protease Do
VEDPRPVQPSISGELDYSLDAYFGEAELVSGFTPDPYTLNITSGGGINADYLGGECRGYAAEASDFQLTWSGDSSLLRVYFEPSESSGDTTLLINMPDGSWSCNDDASSENLNPMVRMSNPPEGVFDIWVGSYTEGERVPGVLSVTELN